MSASPEPLEATILYPKTSGKLAEVLDNVKKYRARHGIATSHPIPMHGTVKLHGSHADILVHLTDDMITYQSRNRPNITPESDNMGFAAFGTKREDVIQELAKRVVERWRSTGGRAENEMPTMVVFAGEWIGTGIQKQPAVAISQLERRLVICAIRVEAGGELESWEPMSRYADIEAPEVGIWNITRGGRFELTLSVGAGDAERFMNAANRPTSEVAARCPFGRAMGVEGPGEGIVWMPAPEADLPNTSDFWLKTKGAEFLRALPAIRVDVLARVADRKARSRMFAVSVCTEERLEQGRAYLQEMGFAESKTSLGRYMKWVTDDVGLEEAGEIEELELKGAWKAEVSRIAREWFVGRLV